MAFFGCMGPVVRAINLSSVAIACLRAWISSLFLIIYLLFTRKTFPGKELKAVLKPMILCGLFMAGDWIGLFESYRYTSIATATVCYYLAPVFVFIVSPVFFGEKFTVKHILCILMAFLGMALVSGIVESGIPSFSEIKGILFALLGAVCYAGITITNKKVDFDDTILRTTLQLVTTAVIMTPYALLSGNGISVEALSLKDVLLLLLLGIGFTALPYIKYMDYIRRIPAQTISLFSYADPLVAVLISVFLLSEPISIYGIIGSVLIILSAIVSERD